MSMNKMFKKVLAVVAAGAMTMGMAMPTFAAEGATTATDRDRSGDDLSDDSRPGSTVHSPLETEYE